MTRADNLPSSRVENTTSPEIAALLVSRGVVAPVTVLRIFKAADAFRKPERFEAFLLAVEADARGRLGYEDMDYVQGRWLRELHGHLAGLSPREFVAQGLRGPAIGEALDRHREGEIRRLRRSQPARFDVRDNHGN